MARDALSRTRLDLASSWISILNGAWSRRAIESARICDSGFSVSPVDDGLAFRHPSARIIKGVRAVRDHQILMRSGIISRR